MKNPLILAIDTSCDETSAAVVQGRRVLSNVIASQINIHRQWGGVVPHLAKRAHLEKIRPIVNKALKQAKTGLTESQSPSQTGFQSSINAIAVTIGPGLAPALEVGVNYAKQLAQTHRLPLISVNHMEGHLLSSLALNSQGNGPITSLKKDLLFPALALLVSGGHTELILVHNIGRYQVLGQTLDDAAGEALDKLAKMLKLGYPGGPIIEDLAKKGDPDQISLPIPMHHSPTYNFSFSGLKTAALYKIRDQVKQQPLSRQYTTNMAAAFQQVVAKSLILRLVRAIQEFSPLSIFLGGGVISNLYIRHQIRSAIRPFQLPLYLPFSKKLLTDNAAMIALPAYYQYLKKDFVKNKNQLDRQPSLEF